MTRAVINHRGVASWLMLRTRADGSQYAIEVVMPPREPRALSARRLWQARKEIREATVFASLDWT